MDVSTTAEVAPPSRLVLWSEDRVEQLKSLISQGKSATQIAGELQSVTRNAVIGKAHRLGLGFGDGKTGPKVKHAPSPRPRRPSELRKTVMVRREIQFPADETPVVSVDEEFSARAGALVPLIALRACDCHWPLGDPRDAGFGFCGRPVLNTEGRSYPYCAEHVRASKPVEV